MALPPPGFFRFYCLTTAVGFPLARAIVARKLRRAGVAEARIAERSGRASLPRPEGRLIWFHAASVGESLSVLTLIERMGERFPGAAFLITSGTATSAELIAKRMPPRCRHQFAPLDAPGAVKRFLDHWRPDAGIFVESELWPLILTEARGRGVPLALLNARLSPKSVRGWTKYPETARFVLDHFRLMLTQNPTASEHLSMMGADMERVETAGNLKATSAPLPVDAGVLAELEGALAGRPIWVAASTHPGEEAVVLAAHRALKQRHPDLCLLLVPRHPERGAEVAEMIGAAGLNHARRSAGQPLAGQDVYLADTLGEMGTWYAAAPFVFLGGSLREIGGHNPFEPAQAGAAVLTGPHVTNFAETFGPLKSLGGALEVKDAGDLERAAGRWLENAGALEQARGAARGFAEAQGAALERIIDRLEAALGLAA